MDFFRGLSIQFKILSIPIVGVIGFCVYLAISIFSMNFIVSQLDKAYRIDYQLLKTSEFTLIHFDKIKETLGNAATLSEAELLDVAEGYANNIRKKVKESIPINKESGVFLTKLLKDFDDYFKSAYGLSKSMIDGTVDFSSLSDESSKMSEKLIDLQKALNQFQSKRNTAFNEAFESVSSEAESTSIIGISVGLITIAILFIVSIPIARGIRFNLQEIIESMKNIAQENGDLTVRLKTSSKDELGDLVFWFNSFIEKLQGIIKNIVDTALPLAETSSVIHRLSEETLDSFKRQSASIEQSKRSVSEMSESVADITQNAADAASSATKASGEANKGKQVVDNTVAGIMQLADNIAESAEITLQLQEYTNKVNVVLEVIRGIAEQTNLLALNAAIEAARAGEQGRGFAVVADEVRNLASRTQDSTREINNMLEQLQNLASKSVSVMENSKVSVDASVDQANKAGESLVNITETVDVINDMNSAIATATEEQFQVSGLMVGHVDDIQSCTDEASIASAEIATVSDRLAELSAELEKIARQFKV